MRRALQVLTLVVGAAVGVAQAGSLPQRLADTGYGRAGMMSFAPQYPLWSDGATKRRWIQLPQGTRIDATDPAAWDFPVGTRFFKEFALGRPIETRVMERLADGSWEFGVYVWNDAGTDAYLAPPDRPLTVAAAQAPGGRYVIPSRSDCLACHGDGHSPVLGFTALQLAPERDPLAPHAGARSQLDLHQLVRSELITGLPAAVLESLPRIAGRSPVERAALGYLHGNCGHCHDRSPAIHDAGVPVELQLSQRLGGAQAAADALQSLLRPGGRFDSGAAVVPGNAPASVLFQRMHTRDPRVQMPPVGTRATDTRALTLIRNWIDSLPASTSPQEISR